MRYFLLIYFTLIIYSCLNDKSNQGSKDSELQNKPNFHMITIDLDTIMQYTLQQATDSYGEPNNRESFNTKMEDITEFRIELRNLYSEEELKNGVTFEELTWEKDSNNNVTIWYVKEGNNWTPKHYLIWDKHAEF